MVGRSPRDTLLPSSRPSIDEEEIAEVVACLRSGWITAGPRVEQFERDFAALTGARHALAFSSATAGLHCAYWALDLRPGDEIVCPSLTWPATVNMIVAVGGAPVFADIDPRTLQIDPAGVERVVTERTRAIVPVHFAGAPADMDALREIAGTRIALIEDAAHALGAELRGRKIGSGGNVAVFSFHATKLITTAEGGMMVTDDADLAARARLFRFHGVERDAWRAYGTGAALHYDTVLAGFKYNMTDMAAALGIHQLRKVERFVARRAAIAARYLAELADLPGVELPAAPSYPHRHAWQLFPLLVGERDAFAARLREANIAVGLHFEAVHTSSFHRGRGALLPVTDRICAKILSLPLFPAMTDADVDDVVFAVRRVAHALSI